MKKTPPQKTQTHTTPQPRLHPGESSSLIRLDNRGMLALEAGLRAVLTGGLEYEGYGDFARPLEDPEDGSGPGLAKTLPKLPPIEQMYAVMQFYGHDLIVEFTNKEGKLDRGRAQDALQVMLHVRISPRKILPMACLFVPAKDLLRLATASLDLLKSTDEDGLEPEWRCYLDRQKLEAEERLELHLCSGPCRLRLGLGGRGGMEAE